MLIYARRFARGLLTDPLARPTVVAPSAMRAVGMVTMAGAVPGIVLQLLFMVGSRSAIRHGVQDILQKALSPNQPPPGAQSIKRALDFSNRLGFALDSEVAQALSHHPDASVGVTLAKSLRRRPQPFAQEVLRRMLGRTHPEVLRAAVDGLLRIGSGVAIADLGGLAQSTYFPAIRDDARAAIRAIRARSGGAGPAALSFPTEAGSCGALSISSGPTGQHHLAPDVSR